MIFFSNDMETLKNVKIILNWFPLCSSLKVNSDNKVLLVGINIDLGFTKGMTDFLRCKSRCLITCELSKVFSRSKFETMLYLETCSRKDHIYLKS